MVALVVGMVGCGGGDGEYDLTIASTTGGWVGMPGEGTFFMTKEERFILLPSPRKATDLSAGQVMWAPLPMLMMPPLASL